MSSARAGAPRRQMSLHYMNSHPSLKTKRSQTRRFIRSHIGSWTQQLVKQNSGESETDEIDESHTQDIYCSSDRADRNSINVEAAGSTSSSASLSSRSQTLDWVAGTTTLGSHDEKRLALPRTNKSLGRFASSPSLSYSIEDISAGTLDPFQTYPSSFPPGFVNRCIKYS
jgi:hypothetical protein